MKIILVSVGILLVTVKLYAQEIVKYNLENIECRILEGRKIETEMLLNPNALMFHDSLLFIRNSENDKFFDILDLKDGNIINRICKKGRGPGEVVYPMSFQILKEENKFLAYDVNLKKVNFYKLDALLEGNPNYFIRSFNVDSAYAKYVLKLIDGTYFCPLIGDKIGFKYFTLNSNESFNQMGTLLPDIGKDYSKIISANLFNYAIGINDANNKIVFAYRFWDRLEIFDFITGQEITINGPHNKIPEFVLRGQNMAIDTKGNINSYSCPCLGENGFFVLYSGEDLDTAVKNNAKYRFEKILYFDYKGKLLRFYNLDTPVKLITVDWENNIIYGINNQLEPFVVEFKF